MDGRSDRLQVERRVLEVGLDFIGGAAAARETASLSHGFDMGLDCATILTAHTSLLACTLQRALRVLIFGLDSYPR